MNSPHFLLNTVSVTLKFLYIYPFLFGVVTAVTLVLHMDKQWASGVTEDLQWQ